MLCNATITRWRRRTGTTGAGEPVLDEVVLAHSVPCERVMPSAAQRATERAAGIALVRVLRVASSALAPSGRAPGVGDRLAVATVRNPDVREEHEVVEVVEHEDEGGVVYELKLGARVDSETEA